MTATPADVGDPEQSNAAAAAEPTPQQGRGPTPREDRWARRRRGKVLYTITMPGPRCLSCGGDALGRPSPEGDTA